MRGRVLEGRYDKFKKQTHHCYFPVTSLKANGNIFRTSAVTLAHKLGLDGKNKWRVSGAWGGTDKGSIFKIYYQRKNDVNVITLPYQRVLQATVKILVFS